MRKQIVMIMVSWIFFLGLTPLAFGETTSLEPTNIEQVRKIPLNRPNISDQDLMNWVKAVVTLPYNFNYENYQENWANAAQYFTSHGWQTFRNTLAQLGNPEHFEKSKLAVSARISGKIVIAKKDIVDGHFLWKVAVPLSISYRGRTITNNQRALAVLLITRVDQSVAEDGIAISQYATSVRSVH